MAAASWTNPQGQGSGSMGVVRRRGVVRERDMCGLPNADCCDERPFGAVPVNGLPRPEAAQHTAYNQQVDLAPRYWTPRAS